MILSNVLLEEVFQPGPRKDIHLHTACRTSKHSANRLMRTLILGDMIPNKVHYPGRGGRYDAVSKAASTVLYHSRY